MDTDNFRPFLLAGNAIFTVQSRATGARYTYRVRETRSRSNRYFVHVLTGPNNTQDYTFAGMLTRSRDGSLNTYQTAKSGIPEKSPSWLGFQWLVRLLNIGGEISLRCTISPMDRCGRCGRPLTTPESVALGLGPDCATKV